MKFEVGKKYYKPSQRYNGDEIVYSCVAIHKGIPVLCLEEMELDDLYPYCVRGGRLGQGDWREYKVPVVHKIRVVFTKDEEGTIRSFIEDQNQRPYNIGDVCGRIGTYVVGFREVTYTENK